MFQLQPIKVKLDDGAKAPTLAHETDGGYDLYARETQIVPAKESATFDTGVHIELPIAKVHGEEVMQVTERISVAKITPDIEFKTVGLLKSKSGLNVKHGIRSEGVIDMGYTGSIVVKLYNDSGYDYTVNAGDKISQLVILPCFTPELEIVDSLAETERGDGGFGSTGK